MPVAIVTGASRGFGHAVAAELVKQGWDLVVDGRDGRALDAAAAELRAANPASRVLTVTGDVADAAHRTELVSASWSLGGLDLLVNNASVLGPSPQPLL